MVLLSTKEGAAKMTIAFVKVIVTNADGMFQAAFRLINDYNDAKDAFIKSDKVHIFDMPIPFDQAWKAIQK